MRLLNCLAVGLLVAVSVGPVSADPFDQVDISSQANFSWSGSGLLPDAPTGSATLGGIPFNIASNGAGNQAWNGAVAAGGAPNGSNGGPGTESITMDVNVYGITNVYTLINTWWGQAGPNCYAWLTFTGSSGATYTKDLVGNVDIRDYNNGLNANSINGTTTTCEYWVPLDGFGNGAPARLDVQDIVLPSDFATQSLTSIQLVDNGGPLFQRVVLDGVTVSTESVVPVPVPEGGTGPGPSTPEPSTIVLLGIGAVSMMAYAWRKRRRTA